MKKFLLVFVIAGLALAGCGGSSSKSGDGGSGSSGGGDDEFSKLLDKQNNAVLRVTYKDGSGDEFTISRDGPDKVAYIKDNEVLIKNGSTVTQCSGLPDDPQCQELLGDVATAAISVYTGLFALTNTYLNAAKASNSFGDRSSETIAGRSAECVTLTLSTLGGVAGKIAGKLAGDKADDGFKSCADKETGVLLLWKPVGVDDDNGLLEAIEVTDPKDSDFTPPATTPTTVEGTTDSTDDSTSGSTDTTAPDDENCTRMTLPSGITMPSGITLPCDNG